MKSVCFLFIVFASSFSNTAYCASSQQFGNDIVAHYEFGKYDANAVIDVAFNGWIYLANANTGYMNINGNEVNLSISKDGGLTWQILSNVVPVGDISGVSDIEVTGNDTNHIRVYISYFSYSTMVLQPKGFVKAVEGLNGLPLPFEVEIGDGSYPVSSVRLATDKHHIGAGSLGNSIGIIYATQGIGSTNTDSIVCLISNDTGSTSFAYHLIDSSSAFVLQDPSLSYGYSPSWNSGKFFIAYRKGDHIAYCKNTSTMSSGFTNPINIDDLTGAVQTAHPIIVCQNSSTDNDSTGLSTMIYTKGADSSGIKLNIFYNMQSSITDNWNHYVISSIQPSDYIYLQEAICFSEYNNNFYLTGYDRSTSSLFVINENFNFSNSTNWSIVTSKYNDSTYNFNHFTRTAISTFNNYIYTTWLSNLQPQVYKTLFDMEQIPLNTSIKNLNELENCIIYPNPSNEKLFINLPEKLKLNSVRISISNYSGRRISDEVIKSNQNKIALDVSQLFSGLYFISISSNSGITIKRKIIIQN